MAEPSEISPAHGRGGNLGELVHIAGAVAVQHRETLLLGGHAGAAAVGGDDERRDGHRDVKGVVLQQRRVDERGVGLGDVGLALPAGDKQRRQAVRGVAADAAAGRGLVVVVATTDLGGRVTDALRNAGLAYEVDDV